MQHSRKMICHKTMIRSKKLSGLTFDRNKMKKVTNGESISVKGILYSISVLEKLNCYSNNSHTALTYTAAILTVEQCS